jgi:hypothetical protein
MIYAAEYELIFTQDTTTIATVNHLHSMLVSTCRMAGIFSGQSQQPGSGCNAGRDIKVAIQRYANCFLGLLLLIHLDSSL